MKKSSFEFINSRRILVCSLCLSILCILVLLMVILIPTETQQKTQVNLDDINSVTARIGELLLLPNDEKPALATVTDKEKLSSGFVGKAENGDKILIYQNNKMAVIYRPSINKIVGIEVVQIDDLSSEDRN